jgi:hypothetical protein
MAASDLRTELAATAARLIAEEGCEYAQAKRRAVQEILGESTRRSTMPDNSEVEHELRRYLRLFGGEVHRALLVTLRTIAADTMQTLIEFDPHLIGAVLNGTATEHSDVHLQLFVDSAKDVELRLMHLGVEFDVDDGDADGERPAAIERLNFVVPAASAGSPQRVIGIRLHIYARDAIRVAARHKRDVASEEGMHPIEAAGRANLGSLRRLIDESGA